MKTVVWRIGSAKLLLVLTIMVAALTPGATVAGDWPQILGPNRDGVAIDEPPLAPWSQPPQPQWSLDVGQGYAGPAVAHGVVVVFHRVGDMERLQGVAADTGQPLWQADFEASYRGGVNPDNGPRCVPLIHAGGVYVFGAAGDLHCVDFRTGAKRWSRAVYAELQGREGYFGAGSTPIVAGGRLLLNVGGRDAGIVAFSLETGEIEWRATREGASYSSPTVAQWHGREQAVFVTRLNVVAVDPRDGSVLFQFPFGREGPTVNAATPLVIGDRLFTSAAYGVGANLSVVEPSGARTVWANDEAMSSQYSTCVHRDGHLYGTTGREDYQNGELRCVELASGRVRWTQAEFGVAHTILVQDRLLSLNAEGRFRLIAATPAGYTELAAAQVSTGTTRALPALAHGRLYFRDNQPTGGKLSCLTVAVVR